LLASLAGIARPDASPPARAGATPAAHNEAAAIVKEAGSRVEPAVADAEIAGPLDVVVRPQQGAVEHAVSEEAKKGYDMLVIGLEPAFEDGTISRRIARAAEEFDGPFAILAARDPHREDPDRAIPDILVPVTGTGFSRHAAEVALALARAGGGQVTALHVANPARRRSWRRHVRAGLMGESGAAVLREIVQLGERQGVRVRPVLRRQGSAEEVILRTLAAGQHDLLVVGASRRPGETLYFGDTLDAVLQNAEHSVLLVSS
jgi:nucleotide-binding universal stress UspA family protein